MNKNVPFLDMKSPYQELKEELDAAYHRVMESGWYILGKEVEAFEQEFARYCNVKHVSTLVPLPGSEAKALFAPRNMLSLILSRWPRNLSQGPAGEI